jgi:hypothetical protein
MQRVVDAHARSADSRCSTVSTEAVPLTSARLQLQAAPRLDTCAGISTPPKSTAEPDAVDSRRRLQRQGDLLPGVKANPAQ